ncbi:hypothetical protein BDW66DRAFT_168456 [Aspergillus desertorum]
MPTTEQANAGTAPSRFYRQYIDKNGPLSVAPSPASSLPPTHLRAPSSSSTRSETNDLTARAQPQYSLDIGYNALGIRNLMPSTTDTVTRLTTPLLDTRSNLTVHLPNGRVLPSISPTASNSNSRSRSSSLSQTGNPPVGQAAGTSHNRSASHTIFSPATPIAGLHPPRAPYRYASNDLLPAKNPLSSPVITARERSTPPLEPRPAFQSHSRSRNASIDIRETGLERVKHIPEEETASTGRGEAKSPTADALANGDSLSQWLDSRPSLEDHIRNRNHSLDIAAERRFQQADANAPRPCLETDERMPDDADDIAPSTSPSAQRTPSESSSGRHFRSHSMELTRANHVKRPYHRASAQSLQTAKPTLISITAKESSSEANGESARPSLGSLTRPRNRGLDLSRGLLQQPNHRASTQCLQTPAGKPFLDTASITVARLAPLYSHPPSPIIEQEQNRRQSLDTNDHLDTPAVPARRKRASVPVPSIRSSPPASSTTVAPSAPVTDSGPSDSLDTDSPPLFPPQPQASAQSVAKSTPTVGLPLPPAFSASMMPDYAPPQPQPQPQPQPGSEAIFTLKTSPLPVPAQTASILPTPTSSITDQPHTPHLEAHRLPTRLSLSKFATQSFTTLRAVAASLSAFQIQSSPSSKSTSDPSSSSGSSASTASIPTPRLPPFSIPYPSTTSDIPLATLTQHVQTQLRQARHLFTSLSDRLTPAENIWVHDTISDTETAVREILILTEGLRVDREVNNGRLGLKTQFRWAVRDSRKAKDKSARLVLCHASLVAVLVRLQGVRAEYARNGTRYASAKAELGPSEYRNLDGHVRKPPTGEQDGPHWNPAVKLQDPGMESAADESARAETRSAVPQSRAQSPISPVSREESITLAPGKLDNELQDMLSWRWAQGRTSTTTRQ